jgi:hypothetical protein
LVPEAQAVLVEFQDRYSEKLEEVDFNPSSVQSLLPVEAVAERQQQRVKHLQVAHREMEHMQAVRYLPVTREAEEVAAEMLRSVETVQLPAGAPAAMVEPDPLRP